MSFTFLKTELRGRRFAELPKRLPTQISHRPPALKALLGFFAVFCASVCLPAESRLAVSSTSHSSQASRFGSAILSAPVADWGGVALLTGRLDRHILRPSVNIADVSLAASEGSRAASWGYRLPGGIGLAASNLWAGRLVMDRVELPPGLVHFIAAGSLPLGVLFVLLLNAFHFRRRRAYPHLVSASPITPEELNDRMGRGSNLFVLDLRHPLDVLTDPWMVPGAIRVPMEGPTASQVQFLLGREVAFYGTCPDNKSSLRIARRLMASGIRQIRPLFGGFDAWKRLGYPLEDASGKILPFRRAESHRNPRTQSPGRNDASCACKGQREQLSASYCNVCDLHRLASSRRAG